MKLHLPTADVFVPDDVPLDVACKRITHLGVGAHQDDLEFMAFHGIAECFESDDHWFGGVTCTNGGGSSRIGKYANYTDEEMMAVRKEEQRQAAVVGRYSGMWQLDYPSSVAKDAADSRVKEDLRTILAATQPSVVYTHNPADKHETHIAVVIPVIQAIRELPPGQRPSKVYGCEMWRDLDWLPDEAKVVLDVSGHDDLAVALNGLFDSQIAGGKRYDLGVTGRRRANATFFQSHGSDKSDALIFAIDLTPLALNASLDVESYTTGFIARFQADVCAKLGKRMGK